MRASLAAAFLAGVTGLAPAAIPAPAVPTTSAPAEAGVTVDLELVLAVDVSGSMDYNEQRVQRDGYVAAFRDPTVIGAITSGPYGRVAVTYIQWAGAFYQQVVVPWTLLTSKDDVEAFAAKLAAAPLGTQRGTSISGAMTYAGSAFDSSGYDSDRRTLDISGDGSNNDGPPVAGIRQQLLNEGIAINGLPIVINPSLVPGTGIGYGLEDYYHDCVIGGPASFVIPIKTIDDFAPAISRKLILEISSNQSLIQPVADVTPSGGVNCALAESSGIGGFGGFGFP